MENNKGPHDFSYKNRELLEKDQICGCFYCLKIFHPSEIDEWEGENEDTAFCPYCGIDSVIGESSGYHITKEFLVKMNTEWF
ncbi:cytoplasmic protein [Fictibacillus iocasae]|uniref:Cytoplasmic protein n=1 Tax=Fictibacillus iocasae TaxID=2715437 RepID=A0ABW2NP50_9BACL